MMFCLDHANGALEISILVSQSIIVAEGSTLEQLLARLYLVNDILYNSTVPSNFYFW